jgi:hypothetical protein
LFTKNKDKIPYYVNSHAFEYEGKNMSFRMGLDLSDIKKQKKN